METNKVIERCTFGKQSTSTFIDFGGCPFFYPTLTSNGVCDSFNSVKISDIWRKSPITESFSKLWSYREIMENFQGSGSTSGK